MSAPEVGRARRERARELEAREEIVRELARLAELGQSLRERIRPDAPLSELQELGAMLRIHRQLLWGLAAEFSGLRAVRNLADPEDVPIAFYCETCGAMGASLLVGECWGLTPEQTGRGTRTPFVGHSPRIIDWSPSRIVPPRPEGGS